MRRSIVALLTVVSLACTSAFAASKPMDAAEIQLALRKLTVVGSALYVAAHPDDENTAMISWLSRDRLYRTGYLAMTRGDGGQNLIGDEKGELLGVIRTQELLAARRVDGSEQFFTRAIDFGYSKNPAETLSIWGHDTILADVVWVIRKFQPDVIITRFPTTGEGGHGHHTASAILAGEAFAAAADPTRFPEQLRYVRPWQARRLYWNRFSFTPLDPNDPKLAHSFRVDVGAFNPLLGRAYTEIAAESRSMHKSQGFGSAERRGTLKNYFDLVAGDAPAGDTRTADLFEGIDTGWSRYPGGAAVGKLLGQAYDSYDPKSPQKSIPLLLDALTAMSRFGATVQPVPGWYENKVNDVQEAIRACAGLAIDVSAADSSVVAGGQIPITVTVTNRSDYPFILSIVANPYATPAIAPGTKLENNVPAKAEISVRLPNASEISQPYWLLRGPARGAFTVEDQKKIGLAENPPSIPINVVLTDAQMHTLIFVLPTIYRWTDAVRGEQARNVDVVPDVTANLSSRVYVFPDAKSKPVTVWLRDFGEGQAVSVRLIVPDGWSATPAEVPVTFEKKGDDARVTFTVTPPKQESTADLAAEVQLKDGRRMRLGITAIEYPHIPAQRVFGDAGAKLVRADIARVGSRVGYIMGAGDEVPDALRQIGYEVELLTDADLQRGDFARYDAVVTGVRAYNARREMKLAHPKLMKYVEDGGTLVVQYNSLNPQPLLVNPPGPYPFRVTDARVTVEEAPVRFTDPASPLLNTPNRITQKDFEGWVQERGVYFPQEWDPRYATMLSSNDPGEPERAGGQLYARVGKGVFVYTSYAWFRQLPAGVPGAYKLFANMVSARP